MSPKQQRGEATADLLLRAALRVFVEQGEQKVTVNAVTRASGVSLGSLYHHFGSIDGLLAALGGRLLGRMLEELVGSLSAARDARSGIEALVTAYLRFTREQRDAALFLHSSYADRVGWAQGRAIRDAQEARLSPLAAWLDPLVAAGEIAPLPQPLIEAMILGPVVAVARRWLAGYGDVDLDEAARELPERIWLALRPGL
ncbi:MAG TPA: TetR/AcrR family transcriptional regulator [Streptomyces sp.]|jgi:AcrR family transcriptional regulator|nr:TetR/AcrR family transcriptional regulator [Streptomyces sp.]